MYRVQPFNERDVPVIPWTSTWSPTLSHHAALPILHLNPISANISLLISNASLAAKIAVDWQDETGSRS